MQINKEILMDDLKHKWNPQFVEQVKFIYLHVQLPPNQDIVLTPYTLMSLIQLVQQIPYGDKRDIALARIISICKNSQITLEECLFMLAPLTYNEQTTSIANVLANQLELL